MSSFLSTNRISVVVSCLLSAVLKESNAGGSLIFVCQALYSVVSRMARGATKLNRSIHSRFVVTSPLSSVVGGVIAM